MLKFQSCRRRVSGCVLSGAPAVDVGPMGARTQGQDEGEVRLGRPSAQGVTDEVGTGLRRQSQQETARTAPTERNIRMCRIPPGCVGYSPHAAASSMPQCVAPSPGVVLAYVFDKQMALRFDPSGKSALSLRWTVRSSCAPFLQRPLLDVLRFGNTDNSHERRLGAAGPDAMPPRRETVLARPALLSVISDMAPVLLICVGQLRDL